MGQVHGNTQVTGNLNMKKELPLFPYNKNNGLDKKL